MKRGMYGQIEAANKKVELAQMECNLQIETVKEETKNALEQKILEIETKHQKTVGSLKYTVKQHQSTISTLTQ